MKNAAPEVIHFKSQLVKRDSLAQLTVPKVVCQKLRGLSTIEGTINGHPFRAALEQDTLRVNRAMLAGSGAALGDTVRLAVLGPEPKLVIPPDLRVALNASSEATTLWRDLTELGKRDWVRWVEGAKTPQTRARRIARTVEQLSSGKRRACCFNVYEYMLRRVQE